MLESVHRFGFYDSYCRFILVIIIIIIIIIIFISYIAPFTYVSGRFT